MILTINGTKCGFLICYELQFPELFEAYKKEGVQLIFLSCYNVSRKPRPALQELGLDQIRSRAADNQMWISAANSSEPYTFSTAQIARPDGSVRGLRRHISGILVHDIPASMKNKGRDLTSTVESSISSYSISSTGPAGNTHIKVAI